MSKRSLGPSPAAIDEMNRILDEKRERELADALRGVPANVIASFSGQVDRTFYPHDGGHRIEYRMGDRLLVEEVRTHDEYTFTTHYQK